MLYIGIDLGTSAVKLLLMDSEGNIRNIVSREYPLYFPHPGWSEQKPEDWYEQTMEGIRELLKDADKSQVAGISFGGQMHGLVILDEKDQVIRPAILWNDGRTTEECDYLNNVIGKEKLSEYPTEVIGQTTPGDDKAQITADIMEFINQGADMVVCSGGMSVDPDDRTPGGIRDTGARVVTYGAPVLPGAMLLIAYYEKEGKCIPILGLPGCVMYAKRTVFDLVLPRIMADDEIFPEEVAAYGEGGLCLNCKVRTFPNCGFGK